MKSNQTNEGCESVTDANAISRACLKSCKRILTQIRRTKDVIFAEARETLEAHDQMLRLTLNEAEALAWETWYPHLVFPILAAEKVQALTAWDSRQRMLGGQTVHVGGGYR
ncbi:MAG: hypothetical protein ACYDH9_14465 [Limisphaerales bacterium]